MKAHLLTQNEGEFQELVDEFVSALELGVLGGMLRFELSILLCKPVKFTLQNSQSLIIFLNFNLVYVFNNLSSRPKPFHIMDRRQQPLAMMLLSQLILGKLIGLVAVSEIKRRDQLLFYPTLKGSMNGRQVFHASMGVFHEATGALEEPLLVSGGH